MLLLGFLRCMKQLALHGTTIAVIVQLWCVLLHIYVLNFAWSHRSGPLIVSTGRVFIDTSITCVKFVNLVDRQKFVNPWRCQLFLFMKKGYNIHNWVALYHLICICLSTKHSYCKEEMKSIGKFVIDKLVSYMLLMVQQTSEGLVTLLQVRGLVTLFRLVSSLTSNTPFVSEPIFWFDLPFSNQGFKFFETLGRTVFPI